MKVLSQLKIAGKLYALIFLAVASMLAIATVSQYQVARVFEAANYASVNTVPSFNNLNDAQVGFNRLCVFALYHILSTEDARMAALDSEIREQRGLIDKALGYYEERLISDEEDRRQLKNVMAALREYYLDLDVALMLSRKNSTTVEARDALEKAAPKVAKVRDAFERHFEYNHRLADASSAEAMAIKNRAFWLMIAITLLTVILIVLVGRLIAGRELAGPIGAVVDNLNQLAAGSLSVNVVGTERRDEVGDIARAAQVFKEFVLKLDTQGWIKTHAGEISAALQQAEDFRALAQSAVSKIAQVIGAGHGAFYVADGDGRYNLMASYGYRERKHLNNSFAVGEGLVGQCAMENAAIMLTAPKDYIRINSGLGEGPPACIIVQPVIHGERVLGVIEMASFQQFGERDMALLDALKPVLATSMVILDRNLKTRELLTAAQEQAERMEKQAAQLEEQQVEMEAQQAELLETENWFRSIIEAAPDGMLVADAAGQILLANPAAESIFGYAPGELVGGQVDQLVPERARGRHASLRHAFAAEGRPRAMGAGPRLTGLRKDGGEVELAITLCPLPPRGTRGKCVSVAVRAVA